MLKKVINICVEPVALAVLFYLTIIRIIFGGGWLSISGSTFEKVLPEFVLWSLVGVMFLWIAKQKKNINEYLQMWRRNWVLLGFIIFAICSMFWSEYFIASLYKIFVLIACSAIAAYIGKTYPSNILLRKLSWFFIIVTCISYGLALLIPAMGTHIGYPYFGAWRGLFFHKNYLGALMAFGTIVFLLNILSAGNRLIFRLSSFCLYLLTTGLVFLSRSATGIILFAILNSGLLLVSAWVKWKNRLRRGHYIILGILFSGLIILTLSHLDFVFGLLNRDTTLTGRLQSWSYLINSGISTHPLFGSGFGATWVSIQFRAVTQAAIGWDFAPLSADNGLMDIFLNLGLVGVILLISTVLLCLFRVVKYALKEQTLISFFPLLAMIFVITANISVSFILELEAFAWFLMVFALFSTTPFPLVKQAEP
jgi:O-antigen ligase